MTAYSKPPVLPAWAETGDLSEVGVNLEESEIQEGWPAGDTPPSRQRMNWVLNFCANAVRYYMQRGLPAWDADEAYLTGAITIGSDGVSYIAIAASTNKDPTSEPTYWNRWNPSGGAEVSQIASFHRTTAPDGWLKADGTTIGDASSGATQRANADTLALFTILWNEHTNTVLHIQDSSGADTTRGASAAADFAAHKRMPLPDYRGEFIRGYDDGRGVDTGRSFGDSQLDQMQQITGQAGTLNGEAIEGEPSNFAGAFTATSNGSADGFNNTGSHTLYDITFDSADSTDARTGDETRARNVAALICIRYR